VDEVSKKKTDARGIILQLSVAEGRACIGTSRRNLEDRAVLGDRRSTSTRPVDWQQALRGQCVAANEDDYRLAYIKEVS
jgi:hypothetical protein